MPAVYPPTASMETTFAQVSEGEGEREREGGRDRKRE